MRSPNFGKALFVTYVVGVFKGRGVSVGGNQIISSVGAAEGTIAVPVGPAVSLGVIME